MASGMGGGNMMHLILLVLACSDWDVNPLADGTPAPSGELTVAPDVIDFGELSPGESDAMSFVVTSTGTAAVTLDDFILQGSGAYALTWPEAGMILDPGESMEVLVTYTPQSISDLGQVIVSSNASIPEIPVDLYGVGLYPAIGIDPSSVSLTSLDGESVSTDVLVESVGSATLEISDHWLTGDRFSVMGDLPVSLEPGESIPLTVTYMPEGDDSTDEGQLWLSTNTDTGSSLVPLQGTIAPPCIGLAEAWGRGLLDIRSEYFGGSIVLENLGGEGAEEICIDRWYVLISEGTQDAGAGDPYYDPSAEYPYGTLSILPGESIRIEYGITSDPAWWCMEHTQYTEESINFDFLGARVPDVVLSHMMNSDQDSVWAWMEDHPMVVVGRTTHYIEPADAAAPVVIKAINMGENATSVTISETIPAGFEASDFSIEPNRTSVTDGGAITMEFDLDIAGAILTGEYEHTDYGELTIEYMLSVSGGDCQGRYTGHEPTAEWMDSDGVMRTTEGSPLIISCP